MCTHVIRWICTEVAMEPVNSTVYPQKGRGMFHPLYTVPIYQTASHHITSHHITSHPTILHNFILLAVKLMSDRQQRALIATRKDKQVKRENVFLLRPKQIQEQASDCRIPADGTIVPGDGMGRQVASWDGEGRSAGCRHLSREEDLRGDILRLQTLHV